MNSTAEAKMVLLSYCRFARQMHYVATEVSVPGNALADVLASDGKNLIEYEVKTSMSDLRIDSKKYKHYIYDPAPIIWKENVGEKRNKIFEIKKDPNSIWRPDVFYIFEGEGKFIVNSFDTVEEAKKYLEKNIGPKAGVPNMLYYVVPNDMWEHNKERILEALSDNYGVITFTDSNYNTLIVQKKAKKLHKNSVPDGTLRTIVARMSSELASITNLYHNNLKHQFEFSKMIDYKLNLKEEEEA